MILSELRARVRAVLGLWDEAGEDVRVALRGLEQGEGVGVDDMDSDEERVEVRGFTGASMAYQRLGFWVVRRPDKLFHCSGSGRVFGGLHPSPPRLLLLLMLVLSDRLLQYGAAQARKDHQCM